MRYRIFANFSGVIAPSWILGDAFIQIMSSENVLYFTDKYKK